VTATDTPERQTGTPTAQPRAVSERMSAPILVAYASRTGTTAGVAEAIGEVLAACGDPVEVRRVQDVRDLSPYGAVVAGSAIHGGQWLPEAMRFVRTHQAALRRRPFAAFLVCMTLAMPGAERYRQGVADRMAPGRSLVLVDELPSGCTTTWAFGLRPLGRGRTRLVLRRGGTEPGAFERALNALLEPGYFVMDRGMLRGIKRRAEAGAV
jgi:hypothetical protein